MPPLTCVRMVCGYFQSPEPSLHVAPLLQSYEKAVTSNYNLSTTQTFQNTLMERKKSHLGYTPFFFFSPKSSLQF